MEHPKPILSFRVLKDRITWFCGKLEVYSTLNPHLQNRLTLPINLCLASVGLRVDFPTMRNPLQLSSMYKDMIYI